MINQKFDYLYAKKGQVMGVKEYKFAGDDRHLLNEYHRQLDSLGDWQINFNSAKEKQTYAFDQIGSGNHGLFATDQYYPTSGNYDFRYKSVECGKNDKVIVDFGSYPQADSVIFKDKYGVKLKVVDGNILSFTGVSQPDTNYIYAYRGDKKIGKLFLNTYQRKIYNVVLVSVNEAKILHEKNVEKAVKKVEESLNKVYNQCAVSFKISHTTISIDDLTTFSHGGSGILSVYNEDQKKVLSAYEKVKKMEDGVFYLFFVDNVTDKKDGNGTSVSGYMPRGYNAGFIYDGGSPHTIAHELGHGIAGLEHVFENSSNSGKTANLMDYASGEELWHFQWDQIQDPSRVWMKWNKAESEGELIQVISLKEAFNIKKQGWDNCAFLSPNGAAIQIQNVTDVVFNQDGAVLNFWANGVKYYGTFCRETQEFYGYMTLADYHDLLPNITSKEVVYFVLPIRRNDVLPVRYTITHLTGDKGNLTYDKSASDIMAKLYPNISFAPLGIKVISVYQEQDISGKYLDCFSISEWENNQVSDTYFGKANSRGVPFNATTRHFKGTECDLSFDENLEPGIGFVLYSELKNDNIAATQKVKLVEFCNQFTKIIGDKKRVAFLNDDITAYYYAVKTSIKRIPDDDEDINSENVGDYVGKEELFELPESLIRYFKAHKIFTTEEFNKHFPDTFDCRDYDLVFSSVDLWKGIDRNNYNKNSHSYYFNKGGLYYYSLEDLRQRSKYLNTKTVISQAIVISERDGKAHPISKKDYYAEFRARFGTDAAVFAMADFTSDKNEKAIYTWLEKKMCEEGVIHWDFTFSGELGYENWINLGKSVECGIGFDRKGGVAIFGNAAFLGNFLKWGFNINLEDYKHPIDSYMNSPSLAKSWFTGASVDFTASVNFDWGLQDVRDLFGKSSSFSIGMGFLFDGDIHFNFNSDHSFVGFGIGAGIGYGYDIAYWPVHSKGFVFTIEEYAKLVAAAAAPKSTLLFNNNLIEIGTIIINMKKSGDYWISKKASKLYPQN